MNREDLTIYGLSYLTGVIFSVSVVSVAFVMNWCATQILSMGYSIPLLVPGFFPFVMYWYSTLVLVFVVGPPMFIFFTYMLQILHLTGGCKI